MQALSYLTDFVTEIQLECDRRAPPVQRRGPQEHEEPVTPTTPTPVTEEAENHPLLVTNTQQNPFFPPIQGHRLSPTNIQGGDIELATFQGNNTELLHTSEGPQGNSIEPSFPSAPERDSENPQRESAPKSNLLPRTVTEQLDNLTDSGENVSHDSNLSALSVPINHTQPKILRPENRTSQNLEIPDNVLDTTEETTPKYIACDPVCGQSEDTDLDSQEREENNLDSKQEIIIREGEPEVSCPNCGDPQNVPYNVLEFVCTNCRRKFRVGVSAERDRDRERECGAGARQALQSQARRDPQQSPLIPPQYMALGIESTHPGYSLLGTSPLANPGDASETFVKSVCDDPAHVPSDEIEMTNHSYDISDGGGNLGYVSCQTVTVPSLHRVPLESCPGTGLYLVMPQNYGSVAQNRLQPPDNPGAQAQTPIEGTRPASDPLPMSPVQESPGTVVTEATIDDTSQPLIGQGNTTLALYTPRSMQNLISNPAQAQPQDFHVIYGIEPRNVPENGMGDGQIELGSVQQGVDSFQVNNGNVPMGGQGSEAQQGNDSGTSSGVGSEGTGSLTSSHESLQDTVAMATSTVSRSTSEDTDSGMAETENQGGVEWESQEGRDTTHGPREGGTQVGSQSIQGNIQTSDEVVTEAMASTREF